MTRSILGIAYKRSYDNMAKMLNKLDMRLKRCPHWDEMLMFSLERRIRLLKSIRKDMKRAMRLV